MEKVILMDGTEYTLAVNGFYSNYYFSGDAGRKVR